MDRDQAIANMERVGYTHVVTREGVILIADWQPDKSFRFTDYGGGQLREIIPFADRPGNLIQFWKPIDHYSYPYKWDREEKIRKFTEVVKVFLRDRIGEIVDMLTSSCKFPAFAWPGGYTLVYHLLDDIDCIELCAKCATEALFDEDVTQLTCYTYDEGPMKFCEDCNEEIHASYGCPYEVMVGNIGMVYNDNDWEEAKACYDTYVSRSEAKYGRAAGEDVTLFENGEPILQHIGQLSLEGTL